MATLFFIQYRYLSYSSNMQSLTSSLNSSATLINKLTLLGFNCKTTKMAINQNTFNTKNSCIKAFEAVTYFLLSLLDKTKSKELFKEVWPIKSVKDSLVYRTRVFTWLTELRRNPSFKHISLRKSHTIDCKGENVGKIIMALVTVVMQHMNIKQDKTLCMDVKKDALMEKNISTIDKGKKGQLELVPLKKCSNDDSKKDQMELVPAKKRPNDSSTSLTPGTSCKKQKVQPRRYSRAINSSITVETATRQVSGSRVNRDKHVDNCSKEERQEEIVLSKEQILTLKRWDKEYKREERINRELLVEGTVAKVILRHRRLAEAQTKLESAREESLKLERAEQERAEQERKMKEKAELERAEQERMEKKRLEEERRAEEQKKKERQKRKAARRKEKELRERVEHARATLAFQNRKEEERRTRRRKR